MAPIQAARSLWFDYGHWRSAVSGQAIDRDGQPVPWYSYPAIHYLRQLDFSSSSVFEYGAGNSTLFWSAVARRVVSAEDDERWYAALRPRVPAHCELVLEPDLTAYADVIRRYREGFDVIVVDGPARGHTRLKCCRAALECLRPGGLIVLDNSDWLPESSRVLRESGLIEVDFTGFVPINRHTQTTSLYLHRGFVARPRGKRLPEPGPGAIPKNWEHMEHPREPSITVGADVLSAVVSTRPVVFQSPSGARCFRVVTGLERDGVGRWWALIDDDRRRLLIHLHYCEESEDIDRVLGRVRGNWALFRAWISCHPQRRYAI